MASRQLLNDRYALSDVARTGGMATVHKAWDLTKDRHVAVKFLNRQVISTDLLEEVYRRETQALKELRHVGIAELLDTGIDRQSSRPFLVLEWLEDDLASLLSKRPGLRQWEQFIEAVGFPILEALAFAHSRFIIHRDVKPSNILVSAEPAIKLTDFGISKFKATANQRLTLSEFVTRPYAPPEFDDGSYSYTRDVHAFVVVLLESLSGRAIENYDAIPSALDSAEIPVEVKAILQRAVMPAPELRPNNAGILLQLLRDAEFARRAKSDVRPVCFLDLHPRALQRLRSETGISLDAELQRLLQDDLNSGCAIQHKKGDANNKSDARPAFQILGTTFSLLLVVDRLESSRLTILDGMKPEFDRLERWKTGCWRPNFEFRIGRDQDRQRALDNIQIIEESVLAQEACARESEAQRQEEAIFRNWTNILDARFQIEKDRQSPLAYDSVSCDGRHAVFTLKQEPDEDLVEQPRRVRLSTGKFVRGEVEEVQGRKLYLYITSGHVLARELPPSGELILDTSAAEIAIRRQKDTIEAIREGRAVRADLKDLIIHPERSSAPRPASGLEFKIKELDEVKKNAVSAAVGSDDLMAIEGPPGTGKTTFIAELILQYLQHKPHSRILLSSQTHVALDHAIGKLIEVAPSLRILRIARRDDRRVSKAAEEFTLDRQLVRWAEEVSQRSEQFLKRWSGSHNIDYARVRTGLLLTSLATEIRQDSELREQLKNTQLKLPTRRSEVSLLSESELEALQDNAERLKDQLEIAKRKRRQIEEELRTSKALPSNPSQWSLEVIENEIRRLLPVGADGELLRKMIDLQANWKEVVGRGEDFYVPLLQRAQVVAGTCIGMNAMPGIREIEFDLCILDEASKATATEALVPLSRARSWVVVGDPKQLPPYQDAVARDTSLQEEFDIDPESIRETLLDRLLRQLRAESKTILSVQHRMVKPIGNLISHCFYGARLKSSRTDRDPLVDALLPAPVVWLTTGLLSERNEQKVGTSYVNTVESLAVIDFLIELNQVVSERGDPPPHVIVLSGYAAQLRHIERAVQSKAASLSQINIECSTVDSIQGREAKLVIYSVTRSNGENRVGHLREMPRINVALSRGRDGLLIVGDHKFASAVQDDQPLRQVYEYIQRHYPECQMQQVTLNG